MWAFTCPLTMALAGESGVPLLKPDTPKFDKPVEKKPTTLKGGVQHSHKVVPAQPKPSLVGRANTGEGQSGVLAAPGNAAMDQKRALKSRAQKDTLSSQATAGIGIIGVKFMMTFGHLPVINKVFPGTPAAQEGVRPRDVIVAVDGIPTNGLTKEEVYDLIVGTPNTSVTLSLLRGGDFTVRRMTRMDFNDITDPQVRRDYLLSL